MISNVLVVSFLLIGLLSLPETNGQITFSRSWVPHGKRSFVQDISTEGASETTNPNDNIKFRDAISNARRDERLATLIQIASNIADMMEEASQKDNVLALRLRNALLFRSQRAS
ncbi:UNVERIFIED_CONTAM: hypothetical protein RMT77_015179 [Armadillidium vulgare]